MVKNDLVFVENNDARLLNLQTIHFLCQQHRYTVNINQFERYLPKMWIQSPYLCVIKSKPFASAGVKKVSKARERRIVGLLNCLEKQNGIELGPPNREII
jgi:hypothetical protein